MKGGIAALLLALKMAKEKPWRFDTSVMVTTDEEITQASQIRYLRRFLEPTPGACFFSLDTSFGYVQIAALGCIHMDIKVKAGRCIPGCRTWVRTPWRKPPRFSTLSSS